MYEHQVDRLVPDDYASLTHEQRMMALVQLQRDKARLEAAEARLMACIAEHPHPDPVLNTVAVQKRYAADEIAVALRVSPQTGRARMEQAVRLVDQFSATLAVVDAGELPFFFARALAHETACLSDEVVARIEAKALERAAAVPDQSFGSFTRAVRRSVLALDPRGADERFEDARAERRVCDNPDGNGMGWLSAYLPDHVRQAMLNRLRAEARRSKRAAQPGDERTMDQREADAFARLALTGSLSDTLSDTLSATAERPTTTGPVEVRVVVAASTLAGFDDQPGEIDGIGPIPAVLARQIAFDEHSTWRRLVTDPLGRLIDYGATVYRPPAPLDRHVRARDKHCRFPGCFRRAVESELDHVRDWADGGPTNAANLQPLCGRHHHVKHEAGWAVRVADDGTTTWISPTGLRRTVEPETYPIDTTGVHEQRERHRRFARGDIPVTVDLRWLRDAA